MAVPTSQLRAGIDYPRNRIEFDEFFPDDEVCLRYLERLRWGDAFTCPRCSSKEPPWRSSRRRLVCLRCRFQASVLSGTIFHRTRTPLRHWFLAAWEITSQKYGASALGLQRTLGLGSYQTAWAWLHKFRRAMVVPDRDQLSGIVEADESYLGGPEAGAYGRRTLKKTIVVLAVEINDNRIGRIRLRKVPNVRREALTSFLSDVVLPGSVIRTDGWKGYRPLKGMGYGHEVIAISQSPEPAHIVMPSVHMVFSLLKRWILGTLQGGISKEHLPYYLDEYTFRFNRWASRARGLLFYRLLEQAVRCPHTPTAALYQGTGRGPRSRAESTQT